MTDFVPPAFVVSVPVRKATIYRESDGEILRLYSGDDPEGQCGDGEAFVDGHFPGPRYTIDTGARAPIARVPSLQSGLEWDDEAHAVVVSPARRAAAAAYAEILDLERGQARIMRERDLGDMTIAEARAALRSINDAIAALRQVIADNGGLG